MILSSLPEGKELTLNNEVLPGIVQSVSVSGRMQADRNIRADGGGGRDFELKGWEPAEISVEVALLHSEKVNPEILLESITALFQKIKDGEAVQYALSFPQTNAWGIGRCYFTGLDSSQNSKQMYSLSLKFVEFRPEIDQVKRQQSQKQQAKDPNAVAGPAPQKTTISQKEQKKINETTIKYDGRGQVRGL